MQWLPVFKGPVSLPTDRTLVMGVLNVTPDSFSDGGRWNDPQRAVQRAEYLVQNGADIIDVGGESTRPGSSRITALDEQERVLQVVEHLAQHGYVISVDTVNATTAELAAEAGATIINDVSGGCHDPRMAEVMAKTDAVVIIQHWRGFPGTGSERLLTENVIPTLIAELQSQVATVLAAGVKKERVILDPGFGFAKDTQGSWEILKSLPYIQKTLDLPLLVGTSRKRMVKELAGGAVDTDQLTAATSLVAAQAGVWGVRVHEPAANLAAIRVAQRMA
ncbi:dihydropteroate synthase [Gleimia coleocanis DSM 15436]|uniref:Dihydropteroate synthase n=1 Tax=Gleimia coleocanis DSM 15436 TaxID=525245 RepID=C0VYW0_9ACTO|nr:dihydropteroate synthase [Gleimia coleocanis]EEH64613.1 dihydropteroate synthase [Gleimia coleocanis DSM 15436]